MNNFLTYNEILAALEGFANDHLLIQSWGCGTRSELQTHVQNNRDLVTLFAEIQSVSLSERLINYDFNFYILDSRSKSFDNLRDIHSDTLQIGNDLRRYLLYGGRMNYWSNSIETVTLRPLVNYTADWLSGWEMRINIQTGFIENFCDIPYNNEP